MSTYDLNKTTDSVESGLFECKNVYLKLKKIWQQSQLNMASFDFSLSIMSLFVPL